MKPVSILIVGAGSRGRGYAKYAAKFPEQARVTAVAEPCAEHREALARTHAIPRENIFKDWREAAARPRLADAVIVATQDIITFAAEQARLQNRVIELSDFMQKEMSP